MNTRSLYSQFHRQLQTFSSWQLIAIANAVTERAWPNFALFCEITEFGESAELRHCLDMLWDFVAGLQSSKNFERLLERLDEQSPSPDDYDIFGVEPALDFTVGLHCTINCAMKASVDEAASALTVSLSTIGKFIKYAEAEDLNGTELSQYIENHELYQVQLDFIHELITMISDQPTPSKALSKELKIFSANDGISQLGISVD
ncbi:DUF416 family protein [Endozoicomonas ascidiicola]|uniref:DUF416 family protein n=1 Tax=Endozoicomonas ascidiicola TaxID=1698521 RepID=UPI00082F190B|nr:DUF416 family protein [Endozoicomonas ascidiicola]